MRRRVRITVYTLLLAVAVTAVTLRVSGWLNDGESSTPKPNFTEEKTVQIPEGPHQRYLLLHHDRQDIPEAAKTLQNLEMSLRYGKLPYDAMTFDQWRAAPPDLQPYRQGAVILIGEDQSALAHTERLQTYVEETGGLLVSALRSGNSPLTSFFGMESQPVYFEDSMNGMRWQVPVYPGLSEQVLSEERINSTSLDVRLTKGSEVWAESVSPRKIPLLWSTRHGAGSTLYWNTTALYEKSMRGAFLQTLLKASGGAKMTVGSQVWFIDDFPSPAHAQVTPGNRTGLTDYDFRLKRWDPDMQAIAAKYGLRYSAGVIFTYNDQVSPPFALGQNLGHEKLFRLEADLLMGGGEIGLHGYNHQSLNLRYNETQQAELGYRPWPSVTEMKQALIEARRLWQEELKQPLPTMYIPPSNVLSPEGKRALVEVFPELRTISAIYQSNEELAAFEQEFLPDPDLPQIMGTPRLTYGYDLSADERFDLYGGIGSVGILSHFNHPDDVFHEDRNKGQDWSMLRDRFDQLVGEVQERFPWLRKRTATELADELRGYHAAEVRFDRSQPGVLTAYASPIKQPLFVEARVDAPLKWQVKEGGRIVGTDETHGLLWVEMTEPKLVLTSPVK